MRHNFACIVSSRPSSQCIRLYLLILVISGCCLDKPSQQYEVPWEILYPKESVTEKGIRRVEYWDNTRHHDSGPDTILYFDSSMKPVDITKIIKIGMRKTEVEQYLGKSHFEHVDEGFTEVIYRSEPSALGIRYDGNDIIIEIEILR